jgi:ribosome biogenesis GTPase
MRNSPDQNNKTRSNTPVTKTGLVVANFGAKLVVEDVNGELHRCTGRRKIGLVVCGDRVQWQPGNHQDCAIIERQPRHSELVRLDKNGRKKTIAANIDQILIMTAPGADFSTGLIDRYLITAEAVGIQPLIIFNKIDLLDKQQLREFQQHLTPYEKIGYPVIFTSTTTAHGLDTLLPLLIHNTSIFVGKSGVGKSSLINVILPDADARVGKISEATGKGIHTTTTAWLYHLPDKQGDVIDSPGIREFGLWQITPAQVASGFREFRPYNKKCRFRDCLHNGEPGCEVAKAVANGNISERRYQSYQRVLASLEETTN